MRSSEQNIEILEFPHIYLLPSFLLTTRKEKPGLRPLKSAVIRQKNKRALSSS